MNVKRIKDKLLLLVIGALVLGVVAGIALPSISKQLLFLGDIFLNGIKMMIVPLIFCSIFLGVLDNKYEKVGKLLGTSIACFVGLFVTTFVISFAISLVINPGSNFDSSLLLTASDIEAQSVSLESIVNNVVPTNIFAPFIESNILQVILVTLIVSIALIPHKEEVQPGIRVVKLISSITFQILDVIMIYSPIAVFALMANTVASYGLSALGSLGSYIVCAYILFIVITILIVIAPIKVITKLSLKHIISSLSKVWVLAFSTASSTATLPTTFKVVEDDFKIAKAETRFILPLSTTLNMIGGAVSFACLSVFATNIAGVELTLPLMLEMIVISTILNMSAPGIPGGGIVLGTVYLTTLGLPIEIMGLIAGIYRIVDMAYTTLNTSADVVGAVVINKVYNRSKQSNQVEANSVVCKQHVKSVN